MGASDRPRAGSRRRPRIQEWYRVAFPRVPWHPSRTKYTKDDHKNDAVVRAFKEKTKVTIAAGVDAESRGASARWVLLAKSP